MSLVSPSQLLPLGDDFHLFSWVDGNNGTASESGLAKVGV